ncbi:unnamed protein product, partial [Symbiodinium pilosum]
MDGGDFQGSTIGVDLDMLYQDGTKLLITNLPQGARAEDLKESFGVFGRIQYAGVDGGRFPPPPRATAPMGGFAGRGDGYGARRPVFGVGRGTVRFETAEMAEEAVSALDGQELRGATISARLDPSSKDGSKIFVDGLEPSVEWQDLKDFCAQVGVVAFVKVEKAAGAPMHSQPPPRTESR